MTRTQSRRLLAATAATVVAAAAAGSASAAAGLAGTWVATGPFGKITLRLQAAGAGYHGTYSLSSGGRTTVSHVVGRSDNADGATQLTLTFTTTHRSNLCGLSGVRLYCQLGTAGTAAFTRG
jgi:hypothetical protein